LILAVVVVGWLGMSEGVYVVMKEGEPRCFRVEVPQDTLIVGDFQSSALTNEWEIGSSKPPQKQANALELWEQKKNELVIEVEVKDPQSNVIHLQKYKPTDRFAITSNMGGEYCVCIKTTTSAWFSQLRWKMDLTIHTGSEAQDYGDIAKKEHLDNLQISVRKLYDRAQGVRSEMNYQKEREKVFRATSESTNTRTSWWSVIQISIVIITAVLQMQYLKSFFRKKKLM